MPLWSTPAGEDAQSEVAISPIYARVGAAHSAPKYKLPDGEMLPDTAYQIVHDEVMLDGNARFNLATFVTTWMEPQADVLMAESVDKNMIDKDEYPQTAEIEKRCVAMLADLWNSPEAEHATGVSTVGSSEACMLAGLALKRRWHTKMRAAGRPVDRPNIVFGQNVQVVWEKFANFWEVEPRYAPLEGDRLHLTADAMLPLLDENTIGVVAILGSTFDGSYEPVADIAAALDKLAATAGPDIPLHVDAASGGFVAPFIDPDLAWDFRLPRVASISSSGHKFGLVYPGVGWVIWRDHSALPDDLVFHVNYLGGDMPTFALNFSRPGSQVVAQYYTFLRLGRAGFQAVQQTCRDVALRLSGAIAAMDPFELITDGSELPVFAFKVKDACPAFTVYDLSRALRERGWLVPAYNYPAKREDLHVLRIVVRNGFSHDMADLLLNDLDRAVEWLQSLPAAPKKAPHGTCFHH